MTTNDERNSGNKSSREGADRSNRQGLGDDQGTRVGSPTPGGAKQGNGHGNALNEGGAAQRPNVGDQSSSQNKRTGAGSEATEGIHSADGDRSESDRSALEGTNTGTESGGGSSDRAGSEPIDSHDQEHRSSYGGGSRPEKG